MKENPEVEMDFNRRIYSLKDELTAEVRKANEIMAEKKKINADFKKRLDERTGRIKAILDELAALEKPLPLFD